MPHVAVMNQSTAIADADIQKMVPAFSHQWNKDLTPVWGIDTAAFEFVPAGHSPAAGAWWVVFLDDSDSADALAYHDLTTEGLPISKVFVKTLRADRSSISVGATHEICEMAVDPWLNSAYQDQRNMFWAGEVCDPVEADRYGYDIGGVLVTDFVTPDWFAHEHGHTQPILDFKNYVRKPFEILSEGYAQKFEHNRGWIQMNGAQTRASKTAVAPAGSRRDRRIRQSGSWKRSDPVR
jgi:hypothetical protein